MRRGRNPRQEVSPRTILFSPDETDGAAEYDSGEGRDPKAFGWRQNNKPIAHGARHSRDLIREIRRSLNLATDSETLEHPLIAP
jgi:hypothetical protein